MDLDRRHLIGLTATTAFAAVSGMARSLNAAGSGSETKSKKSRKSFRDVLDETTLEQVGIAIQYTNPVPELKREIAFDTPLGKMVIAYDPIADGDAKGRKFRKASDITLTSVVQDISDHYSEVRRRELQESFQGIIGTLRYKSGQAYEVEGGNPDGLVGVENLWHAHIRADLDLP